MSDRNEDEKKLEEYRNYSYFETALRDKNLRSFRNIVNVGLLWMVIENALNDYLYDGGSQYGFKRVFEISRSWPVILIGSPIFFVLHSSIFFYWKLRIKFKGTRMIPGLRWNHFWAACVCLQFFGLLNFFGYLCIKYKISVLCRVFIFVDYIVLCMKGYSFVRTNMKYLYENGEKYKLPTFSHYLYFTCAPTLVYKDEFRRSTIKRSWKKLFNHAFEVFACVYLLALLYTMHSKSLQNFGREPFGVADVIYNACRLSLPCFTGALIIHDLLLNCLQNLMAEVTNFGERKFFMDWWTVTNPSDFHIKWNKFIQDFLYIYIYKDFCDYVVPGNRLVAKLAVFGISAILHEMLFFYVSEMILLHLTMSMMASLVQTSVPKTGSFYNFLFLFQMYIGAGVVIGLTCMEYFARQNCLNRPNSLIYFPRLLCCDVNFT